MARRKQKRPHHHLVGGLGDLAKPTVWGVVPCYPDFYSVADHDTDSEEEEPAVQARRPGTKRARTNLHRTTAHAQNKPSSGLHPCFGVCRLVFASPCAVEAPQTGQVDVELVAPAVGHQTTCLSLTASAKEANTNVQVLLPVPSYGAAAAFIRLVHTQRITLSITPCEESVVTHLLTRAATSTSTTTTTTSNPQEQDLLHKSHCFTAPTPEAIKNLGQDVEQAPAPPSAALHPHVTQLQDSLPAQVVRLVVHQGVDLSWPEAQPTLHSPAPTTNTTTSTSTHGPDDQPWLPSCWLSARLSALLLPESPQAALSHNPQPGDAAAPPASATPTAAPDAAHVLLPGEADGLWQLVIQLSPELCSSDSDGQRKASGRDDDDEQQEGMEVEVVAQEGQGKGRGGTAADDGDPAGVGDDGDDADDETRTAWQDDLLAVLRWLLPAHAPHMHAHSSAHHPPATWQPTGSSHAADTAPGTAQAASLQHPDGGLFDGAFSAPKLYKAVKPSGCEPEYTGQLPGLVPTLRPYQRRAVAWMLSREQAVVDGMPHQHQAVAAAGCAHPAGQSGSAGGSSQQVAAAAASAVQLHPLWRRLVSLGGAVMYLNPFSGRLKTQAPALSSGGPSSVKGGILCDEMGLGKTVELLACIMTNRFTLPKDEPGEVQEDKQVNKQHIHCPCGYKRADPDDDGGYDGLWVMCDQCQAWMHGACVGVARRSRQSFTCSGCKRKAASQQVTGPCGTTLIVCPPAILAQWWSEIHKHVAPGAITVKVYSGQMQAGSSSSHLMSTTWALPTSPTRGKAAGSTSLQLPDCVSAADLASADIVLTTYDALKRDLDRQPDLDVPTKQFRRHKKYEVVPTPLTRLRWWRIVLDEAQMVESSTAKAASMALKLQAVHRWCVTGTPISRGLEDVYGLMAFLKVRPWASHMWWMRGIQRPAEEGSPAGLSRLLCLLKPALGGLMWRTAKQDVLDQLGIPVQHHHVTLLYLSPVERHFYMRQHQDCAAKVRDVLPARLLAAAASYATEHLSQQLPSPRSSAAGGQTSQVDRPLTSVEQKKLAQPLLRLRQAACHPQVGVGGIKAVTSQRAPMTMEEILQVLIAKAKIEAEEAQRALIASLNGIAALILLEKGESAGMGDAVVVYREAVQVMEGNKQNIDTDPLQTLHTLYNLNLLLTSGAAKLPGMARTLRDDTLQKDIDAIRHKYVEQRQVMVAVRQEEYNKATTAAAPFDDHQGWFLSALDMLGDVGLGESLSDASPEQQVVAAVKEHLAEKDTYRRQRNANSSSIAKQFRSLKLLKDVLLKALDDIETHRHAAMTKMQELIDATARAAPEFVAQAGACRCREHLSQPSARLCEHCVLDEQMIHWEIRLFCLYSQAKGNAQVSAEEVAKRAAAHMRRQVNSGGLGEGLEGGQASNPGGEGTVLDAQILWKPSEAEEVLKLLSSLFTKHCVNRAGSSSRKAVLNPGQVRQIAGLAKTHLERLESQRKLFPTVRALSVAQRTLLYAHDELDMAVARTRFRQPGEWVSPKQENFKIWPEEIPIRNKDLSNDKLVAEADLRRSLGTLRYLGTLKSTRQAALAEQPITIEDDEEQAAGAGDAGVTAGEGGPAGDVGRSQQQVDVPMASEVVAAEAGDAGGGSPGGGGSGGGGGGGGGGGASVPVVSSPAGQPSVDPQHQAAGPSTAGAVAAPQQQATGGDAGQVVGEICPICHDPIRAQFSMLPCGHMVCCDCIGLLVDKVGSHVPRGIRKVTCPTCRMKVPLDDISHVETGRNTRSSAGGMAHTLHTLDPSAAAGALSHPWQSGDAGGAGSEGPEDLWAGEQALTVSGSYGTKIEAVVRRLLYIINSDEDAKVLVFSSWLDLLEVLAHALATNKLPFALAKGRQGFQKSLAAFQGKGVPPAGKQAGSRQRSASRDAEGEQSGLSEQEEADANASESEGGESEGESECEGEDEMKHEGPAVAAPSTSKPVLQSQVAMTTVSPAVAATDVIMADTEQQPGAPSEQGGPGQVGEGGTLLRRSGRSRRPRKVYGSDAEEADDPEDEQGAGAVPRVEQPPVEPSSKAASAEPGSGGPAAQAVAEGSQRRTRQVRQQAGSGVKRAAGGRRRKAARGSGGVSLSSLRSTEPPRILLLLMSQGGAGLNLTEAQHVVLLEPSTDPAAEAQAVGRIHRIGQTRETHVHRFVVRSTVEENVAALSASRAAAMDMSHAAAAAVRSGKNQEGVMRVCDVALLLTTPWSHEAQAGEGAAPVLSLEEEEDAAQQQEPQQQHATQQDANPGAGSTAAREPGPAARAAAAAELRWRQQQQQASPDS